ncbi:MAG TPA: hypothetical protein VH642_06325 [Streptosporangiaceae bacterium]|jgi:hypothetical protein
MFVTRELIVDAEFGAARTRLREIVRAADGGGLAGMSRHAYEQALTRLTSGDTAGGAPVASQLVEVRMRGPVKRDETRAVWLRWEAAGEASGLLPTLDADIVLAAEGQDKTRVTLNGYYESPLDGLADSERSLLHHLASATIRTLLRSVADELAR